jgi:hypothetical protein
LVEHRVDAVDGRAATGQTERVDSKKVARLGVVLVSSREQEVDDFFFGDGGHDDFVVVTGDLDAHEVRAGLEDQALRVERP